MKLKDYVKPIVEIYEIQAEKGFAGSHGHGHGHGGGHGGGKDHKDFEEEDELD